MGKKLLSVILLAVTLIGGLAWHALGNRSGQENKRGPKKAMEVSEPLNNQLSTMQLSSTAFGQNEPIPSKYTCDGEDINPPLVISGVPAETKSLVLIMDDPDVPLSIREDGTWDHWVVFNIPPDFAEVGEGTKLAGVQGAGTSGDLGYHGPCPPDREHRYFFKLYALDTKLSLRAGASKWEVQQEMEGHILDKAELIGLYKRTQQ